MLTDQHYTVFDTTDLVDNLESFLNAGLSSEDHFQLFDQLFQVLDKHHPSELSDRSILDYSSLIFANHLTFNRNAVDEIVFDILERLYQRLQEHRFYVNGALMYFPFKMNGPDLCVRRYQN
jgi:hypothetical protein